MQQQPMRGMQLVLRTPAMGPGKFMQALLSTLVKMRHQSYGKAACGRAYS